MNKYYLTILTVAVGAMSLVYTGCKKDQKEKVQNDGLSHNGDPICTAKPDTDGTLPYNVSLLSKTANEDGTTTWIWTVSNPKPGDGSNGTMQDLSHWNLSLGQYASVDNILKASTSTDGQNWTDFTVKYEPDNIQNCYTDPVVKFDAGTTGSKMTYYRLILNKDFSMDKRDAVFVSRTARACGHFKICAIGKNL